MIRSVSSAARSAVLQVVREYRGTRDVMVTHRRATHLQFIMMCNERALSMASCLPLFTVDEAVELYNYITGVTPGFYVSGDWADYDMDDREAFSELVGTWIGILRHSTAK